MLPLYLRYADYTFTLAPAPALAFMKAYWPSSYRVTARHNALAPNIFDKITILRRYIRASMHAAAA